MAKTGERYDVQVDGDGRFVLTRLEPIQVAPTSIVKIVKRDKYSVGVLNRPINERALKEALSDFP
jgi:hypothetical protein